MEYLRLRAREVAERLLARVPRGEDACVMKTWRAGGEGGTWENAFIGAVTLRALAQGEAFPALRVWRDALAGRLRAQMSARGSWNYWLRGSVIAQSRACPDDLDTTICASTALARNNGGTVSPEHLANLIHILTALETAPGGPYRTWLTLPDAALWADVDPVVNAHVGWFLRERDVTLPRLRAWATGVIDGRLASPYYPSRLPLLYALAHWYDGPAKERLQQQLWEALRTAAGHPLCVAMAVTGLCRIGAPLAALLPYVPQLAAPEETALRDAYWIDGVWGGTPTLAGSEVLTLAMGYEALCAMADAEDAEKPLAQTAQHASEYEEVQRRLHDWCAALPSPLGEQAMGAVQDLLARDTSHRRTLLPWLLARAATGVGWGPHVATLCAANALGWLAYTAYDNMLDGDADASVLCMANAAMRGVLSMCASVHVDVAQACSAVFHRMDAANAWELTHCALDHAADEWRVPAVLPDFSEQRLWERSLGAAFLPKACAAVADYTEDAHGALQNVQCALIAARQLSDDAHDWESDLLRGRMNSVAVQILRRAGMQTGERVDAAALARLRTVFWDEVLDDVVAQAEAYAQAASVRFAAAYPHGDARVVDALAVQAIRGMQNAQAVRNDTRALLNAYSGAG